jgi:hypothetical protein
MSQLIHPDKNLQKCLQWAKISESVVRAPTITSTPWPQLALEAPPNSEADPPQPSPKTQMKDTCKPQNPGQKEILKNKKRKKNKKRSKQQRRRCFRIEYLLHWDIPVRRRWESCLVRGGIVKVQALLSELKRFEQGQKTKN